MYAYIKAKNLSNSPVISVYINDTLYFRDLIGNSISKECDAGSIILTVLDNREKVILDLYLPVSPRKRYLLEILTNGYNFTPLGFF